MKPMDLTRREVLLLPAIAALPNAALTTAAQERTPQSVFDELLSADRAFSAASRDKNVVDAVTGMLSDDAVMLAPGELAEGTQGVSAALASTADNLRSSQSWTPAGGGISADGTHGFTFGTMVVTRQDGGQSNLKYLAYWVKGVRGWRVAVYKRTRGPERAVPAAMMAPTLPGALRPINTKAPVIEAARKALDAAERGFSEESQTIGVGPAFAKWGSVDAINLGGPTVDGFLVGTGAIGAAIGRAYPPGAAPIHWYPDKVLIASSGDLGVTIGYIYRNPNAPAPPPGAPEKSPFFTVWRKQSSGEWRYIAE